MKKLFSLVCTCLLAMSMQAAETDKYDALYENLPFQMEKVTRPQFPANEVNLKDFGAVGDGSTLCTEAFSKAIEALSQKGGGKLIVPQGVWFTGPITLKSNINLHIEKGGIILFSPDDALYPFGYGLSYSTFEYSDATLSKSEIGVSESLKASVTVTNNGPYDGDDVVQLYIRDEYGSVTRPVKELKAFRRISLKNGESTKVEFDITPEMLQCWGVSEKWSVEPGDFTILLGSSSSDSDLTPLPLKVK